MENIKIVILVVVENVIMCIIFYYGFRTELNSFSTLRMQPRISGGNLRIQGPKKNVTLLVIVLSAVSKQERRMWIRRTWWKDCQKHKQV